MSKIEGNDVVPAHGPSCFMKSSGCSNILRERLNCFLGLIIGLEFFLT